MFSISPAAIFDARRESGLGCRRHGSSQTIKHVRGACDLIEIHVHFSIFMTEQFDAIIIGTGQAGPFLAKRLAAAGMKVAIVERKLFGGTCVNTGCIPTKTMVASAYAAHMARRAADFGVAIDGGVSVDMRRVKARKDAISGKSRIGLETWLKHMENCTVYEGHARFESPREVSVGAEQADGRPDLHQRRWTRDRASACPASIRSSTSPTAR